MLKKVSLKDFLETAQVAPTSKLPWLHTTHADNVYNIFGSSKILATPCSVFRGENLSYLFVGRPAYKYQVDEGETPYYLLPLVFVIRFSSDPQLKRVLPFDSGAFETKRLPSYVTFLGREIFELAPERASIGKVVSAFFGSDQNYMRRKPRDADKMKEEHTLTPRHSAIDALNRLYGEKSSERFDDRAAAIELQLDTDIDLSPQNLLGIVMPREYERDEELLAAVKGITKNIELYDVHPLNIVHYFSTIYDAVNRIYRNFGIGL